MERAVRIFVAFAGPPATGPHHLELDSDGCDGASTDLKARLVGSANLPDTVIWRCPGRRWEICPSENGKQRAGCCALAAS